MSLFTSDFRSEGRVLLSVVIIAAFAEGGLRLGLGRLASDVKHIRTIPRIAERLARAQGPRVLFVGNSLTRAGIHLDVVARELSCRPPIAFERVHPDDSMVLDWYYLFRNDFGGRLAPDYVVVDFMRGQLRNSAPVHADRIASAFGGWSNAPEMLTVDLDGLGDRIEYVLSCALRLFSERERVRSRVLAAAVPDYRDAAQRLNEATRLDRARSAPKEPETYSRLRRLLQLFREQHVHAVFVAMPIRDHYDLDSRVQDLIRQNGADFIDMRQAPGLTATDFPDGSHLSLKGADVYSAALGRRLREIIRCEAGWNPGPLGPVIQEAPDPVP